MAFSIPDFDDVNSDGINLPSEGWHDATLVGCEARQSSNGNDMMVMEFQIDSGSGRGHTLVEYIVFGLNGLSGEAKLKKICEGADFRWTRAETLDAFVEQFPLEYDPGYPFRVAVKVEWNYSIKENGSWEDVPQEGWETFEGEKNVRAQPAAYREPSGETEAAVVEEDPAFVPDEEMPF